MCWGIILRNCDTGVKYMSYCQCGADMSVIPVTRGTLLIEQPLCEHNKVCHQGCETC